MAIQRRQHLILPISASLTKPIFIFGRIWLMHKAFSVQLVWEIIRTPTNWGSTWAGESLGGIPISLPTHRIHTCTQNHTLLTAPDIVRVSRLHEHTQIPEGPPHHCACLMHRRFQVKQYYQCDLWHSFLYLYFYNTLIHLLHGSHMCIEVILLHIYNLYLIYIYDRYRYI